MWGGSVGLGGSRLIKKKTKPKADARRPVTRKSPKSEGSKLRQLQERLKEARKREADAAEQQTATSEILRVISA